MFEFIFGIFRKFGCESMVLQRLCHNKFGNISLQIVKRKKNLNYCHSKGSNFLFREFNIWLSIGGQVLYIFRFTCTVMCGAHSFEIWIRWIRLLYVGFVWLHINSQFAFDCIRISYRNLKSNYIPQPKSSTFFESFFFYFL